MLKSVSDRVLRANSNVGSTLEDRRSVKNRVEIGGVDSGPWLPFYVGISEGRLQSYCSIARDMVSTKASSNGKCNFRKGFYGAAKTASITKQNFTI